jgi:H+/Cl- antiporter ClcA
LKILFLSPLVGALSGVLSALFLFALGFVTDYREQSGRVIFLLPLGGLLIGLIYHRWGKDVEAGHKLLLSEIHDPEIIIPVRMVPLIFSSTILTHLFGGSAGREGTAVQMGGALGDGFSIPLKLKPSERSSVIMVGMCAGFSSIFGTPFAGSIFGLEILRGKRIKILDVLSCVIAAFTANAVSLSLGIKHTIYLRTVIERPTLILIFYSMLAGLIFGVTALSFKVALNKISNLFTRLIPYAPFRPMFGGVIIAAGVLLSSGHRFIGLGIPYIAHAFNELISPLDFLWKMLFTVLTLGAGFKGGEVTPLFYIGATLGNSLSRFFPLSLPCLAALGFVGVFSGASRTPIACTILAMELFGPQIGLFAAFTCIGSQVFSSRKGSYHL